MAHAEDVGIEGVKLLFLESHPDDRGAFTEMYRREWLPSDGREMVQGNLSLSHSNVLRGLHFHRKQADYWCVVRGTAFVALFDLRAGSPTEGKKAELSMSGNGAYQGLYIPRGVAHGFYAQTDVWLQYLVDEYFTGSDEYGVAWDDRELGIDWPSSEPTLSARDRSNPPLAEVIQQAPSYERT
jgi:dTDP-4-dehydrorhamnose 3,5-epimerase